MLTKAQENKILVNLELLLTFPDLVTSMNYMDVYDTVYEYCSVGSSTCYIQGESVYDIIKQKIRDFTRLIEFPVTIESLAKQFRQLKRSHSLLNSVFSYLERYYIQSQIQIDNEFLRLTEIFYNEVYYGYISQNENVMLKLIFMEIDRLRGRRGEEYGDIKVIIGFYLDLLIMNDLESEMTDFYAKYKRNMMKNINVHGEIGEVLYNIYQEMYFVWNVIGERSLCKDIASLLSNREDEIIEYGLRFNACSICCKNYNDCNTITDNTLDIETSQQSQLENRHVFKILSMMDEKIRICFKKQYEEKTKRQLKNEQGLWGMFGAYWWVLLQIERNKIGKYVEDLERLLRNDFIDRYTVTQENISDSLVAWIDTVIRNVKEILIQNTEKGGEYVTEKIEEHELIIEILNHQLGKIGNQMAVCGGCNSIDNIDGGSINTSNSYIFSHNATKHIDILENKKNNNFEIENKIININNINNFNNNGISNSDNNLLSNTDDNIVINSNTLNNIDRNMISNTVINCRCLNKHSLNSCRERHYSCQDFQGVTISDVVNFIGLIYNEYFLEKYLQACQKRLLIGYPVVVEELIYGLMLEKVGSGVLSKLRNVLNTYLRYNTQRYQQTFDNLFSVSLRKHTAVFWKFECKNESVIVPLEFVRYFRNIIRAEELKYRERIHICLELSSNLFELNGTTYKINSDLFFILLNCWHIAKDGFIKSDELSAVCRGEIDKNNVLETESVELTKVSVKSGNKKVIRAFKEIEKSNETDLTLSKNFTFSQVIFDKKIKKLIGFGFIKEIDVNTYFILNLKSEKSFIDLFELPDLFVSVKDKQPVNIKNNYIIEAMICRMMKSEKEIPINILVDRIQHAFSNNSEKKVLKCVESLISNGFIENKNNIVKYIP